ncbi:MAG: hypothetical protein A2V59_06775 [Armatimonadetes bacterium RBG_19FT_COMBO_69_19]|nr:MAG: hypothetical protein A2V59_06775 [Armatimonadetes bacterium RBG_19FT_COMBO_69_19]
MVVTYEALHTAVVWERYNYRFYDTVQPTIKAEGGKWNISGKAVFFDEVTKVVLKEMPYVIVADPAGKVVVTLNGMVVVDSSKVLGTIPAVPAGG